jgi:hypothetical protein
MPISTRNRGLFAALESEYGGEYFEGQALVGADALQVMELSPNPIENLRMLEREIIRDSFQPEQAVYGGSLFGFSFQAELKGSGAAGTAPRIGRLLRACGLKEVIVPATSVTYSPESDIDEHGSLTIGFREGANWRVIVGCRGNVALNLAAGSYGRLNFTFVGHIYSEAEAAPPAASFETTLPPAFLSAAFAIGAYAAPIESMTLDLSNTMSISPDPNSDDGYGEIRVTARNTQGTVNPEAEDISTKNYINELRGGTQQEIKTGVIGSAGNRWALTVPKAYWRSLAYADREALLTFDGGFGCVETVADDEFNLAFT